jgi:regulator of protease activity HflC (stomatin/prohibitin superfamily)
MLDKIFQFLASIWNEIVPCIIVRQYQTGAKLHLGKFKELLGPGLHWKIPLIQQVELTVTLLTTMALGSQSLTTKDNKNVVVSGVIKYKISDLQKFYTEVYDAPDAIADMTQSIIKNIILNHTWEECLEEGLDSDITKKARVEAKKWGLEVYSVTLTSLGQIKTIRLIQDKAHHEEGLTSYA